MDRFAAPQAKRKIKKEAVPVANSEASSSSKKTTSSRETAETNGPVNNKDYACVGPDTIAVIAESIGIPNIGDDVAASLAEDVSYRLQEIINASCTIMRKSKRRKLLPSDVSSAFRTSNVSNIFGHGQKEEFNFVRLAEGDIYVAEDREVDLISLANSPNVPKIKKPSYVATSYPVLHSVHNFPVNGHSIKTEGKSLAFHSPKSGVVNGDIKLEPSSNFYNQSTYHNSNKPLLKESVLSPDNIKKKFGSSNGPHFKPSLESRSKLNGRVRFASQYGIREKLKRDSEEEFTFTRAQISFFNVIAKSIIEGHHHLFQQALSCLRQSRKVDSVAVPLLNFVALSVCHIPRHFGFLTRLLDTIDVLLSNTNVNPTHTIAVNRLVNALLAITADQNVLRGKNDFLLRRKSAQLLTRVLLVWGIEELHVSELLSRVARVLGDTKEKIPSHFGALVIFQSLGKAGIGWLSPLLKCFLPILDKRFPMTAPSNIQLEEIRGVLLDIVELLFCGANSYRFKIKASTIQETQAMIQLDNLLYQHCGDAVCARRRRSWTAPQEEQSDRIDQSNLGLKSRHQVDFRYISDYPQKHRQNRQKTDYFEDMCLVPIVRRKDIQFKFAGANPVPKDGLRKKVLGKTLTQFTPVSNTQLPPSFPRQYLTVGRMHRSRCKRPTNGLIDILYNAL